MGKQKIGTILTLLCVVLTTSPAWADDTLTLWTQDDEGQLSRKSPLEVHSTAVDVHFGLATPQGLFGIGVTQGLNRHFSISASGGYGFTGYHLALMPRVQFTYDQWLMGAGVGASLANYDYGSILGFNPLLTGSIENEGSTHNKADAVVWGSGELFTTYQDREGFRFGFYGGLTMIGYAHNATIRGDAVDASDLFHGERPVLYLGANIGQAF